MKNRQYKEIWQELKEILTKDYIEQINYINQHNITDANDTWSSGWNMSTAQQLYTDLHLMDKLDGTNDFNNLLSDIEMSDWYEKN